MFCFKNLTLRCILFFPFLQICVLSQFFTFSKLYLALQFFTILLHFIIFKIPSIFALIHITNRYFLNLKTPHFNQFLMIFRNPPSSWTLIFILLLCTFQPTAKTKIPELNVLSTRHTKFLLRNTTLAERSWPKLCVVGCMNR